MDMDNVKKNEIVVAAKLGDSILIMNKADIPYIGGPRSLEVFCVKVDLEKREVYPPVELEKHLKFNPWEETTEQDKVVLSALLYSKISDEDIYEKIILPLTEKLVDLEKVADLEK